MPDIRFSAEIQNRYQFGALCHSKGLLGTAIEIGVHRGEFAGHFLAGWGGKKYHAVDPYLPYCDNYKPRDLDKQIAHTRLQRFCDRVVWECRDSMEAIEKHAPESIDFSYTDGDHNYWAVTMEMRELWPRIRPAGIFAGHDFGYTTPDVMRAVREFSDREKVTVWLTQDDFQPWSWFAYKPEDR